MYVLELFLLSWNNLWRSKLRTIFTIIGIAIGSGAILAMVSFGIGLQNMVTEEVSAGADFQVLEVMPGYDFSSDQPFQFGSDPDFPLTEEAIREIKAIDGVEGVTPVLTIHGANVVIDNEEYSVSLMGIDFSAIEDFGMDLENENSDGVSEGLILGNKFKERISEESKISDNETIKIGASRFGEKGEEKKDYSLNYAGTLEEQGRQIDYSVLVPIEKAEDIFKWTTNDPDYKLEGYEQVQVQVESLEVVDDVTENLEEQGFIVFSLKQVIGVLNAIFRVIQVILGAIGSTALLVAALGIVNTMFMSIYERVREVGIIKVVGASFGDIRAMFVIESATIGFVGGVLGIIFGWLFAKFVNFVVNIILASQGGESLVIADTPVGLLLFILCFTTIIGTISGLYPATKAMKMSPLDAIRQD
ncbi:FtsX-like permease family protein [Proteinivorax tanatarense]|uniref:FtsX-like permease family protein n=1 Tax=Proteinivorax tanatarense TaxID=1260629 RepID=A0AAU7VPC2_9FIRM